MKTFMQQIMKTKKKLWPLSMVVAGGGIVLITLTACHKKDDNTNTTGDENGYVTGVVTDTKGQPISGAGIVIDNTLIYNSNLITVSDANGKYKVKLSGSFTWMAYATFNKSYNGKTYKYDLHPEKDEGFTSDGAVRNFSWKIAGNKPGSTGYYGGMIQLQSAIGSPVMAEDVDFILTPDGPLIDGSAGQTLTLRGGPPRSATYFKLADVPLGRYKVKAKYNGQFLNLLNTTTNQSGTELVLNFEPEISGYCTNCAVIQYE
jgi:hypothetical protein